MGQTTRDPRREPTGRAVPAATGADDPLARFSRGDLGRVEAMTALGVDYGTLLQHLADRDLPLPTSPPDLVDRMADEFVRVWGRG